DGRGRGERPRRRASGIGNRTVCGSGGAPAGRSYYIRGCGTRAGCGRLGRGPGRLYGSIGGKSVAMNPRKLLFVPLVAAVVGSLPAAAQQPDPFHLERVRQILRRAPLIDGHNDLPWAIREYGAAPMDVDAYDLRRRTPGHTDLERLRAGMVGAQFWSVYVPGEYADSGFARVQLEQIDIARRVIAKYPDHFVLALTADDVERAFEEGKIASLLGLEGGHVIENSLGALRTYYELGARYMTLTHNVTTDWADACCSPARHDGLTRFGEEVVREMNRLGMLVDLSHVSP